MTRMTNGDGKDLVTIYSVQPAWVVGLMQSGLYKPDITKGFGSEHALFSRAYKFIREMYNKVTSSNLEGLESGLWGYPDSVVVDGINHLNGDYMLCIFKVPKNKVLFTDYSAWESLLDGELSYSSASEELLPKVGKLKQAYFSIDSIVNSTFVSLHSKSKIKENVALIS